MVEVISVVHCYKRNWEDLTGFNMGLGILKIKNDPCFGDRVVVVFTDESGKETSLTVLGADLITAVQNATRR